MTQRIAADKARLSEVQIHMLAPEAIATISRSSATGSVIDPVFGRLRCTAIVYDRNPTKAMLTVRCVQKNVAAVLKRRTHLA